MKYSLCLKDSVLVSFAIVQGEIRDIERQGDPALYPVGLGREDHLKVDIWLKHRKIPKHRQFADQILAAAGDGPYAFLDVSYGLSLNDAYWVKPEWVNKSWDEVNLYRHPFDKMLSNIAFCGYSAKAKGLHTSPEYTTNGYQKKAWIQRDGNVFLMKGIGMAGLQNLMYSRPDGRSEAFSEYYAAQVAETMGLPHVSYDLENFRHEDGRKEVVSICPLFTSEDVGYVPCSTFEQEFMHLNREETFAWLEAKLGKAFVADLFVFDSLIYNQDRHLGNFGLLWDNISNRPIGPAPLFDHGASLFCGLSPKGIENLKDLKYGAPSLGNTWEMPFDEIAKRFVEKRHLPMLRKMTTFRFARHPRYNIAESSLTKMERFLQTRAREMMAMVREKETKQQVIRSKTKSSLCDRKRPENGNER